MNRRPLVLANSLKLGTARTILTVSLALFCGGTSLIAQQDDPAVIFEMDTARHTPTTSGEKKVPIGKVEVVPGKFGDACRFDFAPDARSGFFTAAAKASPAWDNAAGISFWVKGDGSANWGGLEVIDRSDYSLRYAHCFPIDSTDWRKITVPWCDLIPELPAGRLVNLHGGYAPSNFGNIWFGKWYFWRDYPACSFTIDRVALEPSIPLDRSDHTPPQPGTPRLLAKLKAGKPITVVTMGDSLSDERHWANRDVLWSEILVDRIRKEYGSKVQLINPAIGGTQLAQNLILMPRWLKDTPQPDLVTIWFGYNDWSSGMREERWLEILRFAVDRIRRLTQGQTEIILITTCPAVARWDTMEELAEGVRLVQAEKKTGLADVAAAFHLQGTDPSTRENLFCRDKTHLGPPGHQLAAKTVLEAIADSTTPATQ